MAYLLPARGSGYPTTKPMDVDPDQAHLLAHTKAVNETHHYLCAYYGASHVGQRFGLKADCVNGLCRDIAGGAGTLVLTYAIRPRLHMKGLDYLALVSGDNGASLKIKCVETGVTTTINFAAGTDVAGVGSDGAVNRGSTLTHLEVTLVMAGGGTYADLTALSVVDSDLAAGDLP